MVASTDTKFYVYTNNNAPQLPNEWGALVNILDACLITGFSDQMVSQAKINGSVLTLTTGAAHGFNVGQVVALSGASESEFNKEYRITVIPNATTLQVDLDVVTSLTWLTGAISVRLPPLGWVKEFSAGGKRAYRNADSNDPDRPFLRVVDEIDPVWTASYAKYAKVGIVERMNGIDEIIGIQTPFDVENPNKNWIGTGSGASAYNGWAKWYYSRIKDVFVGSYYDNEGSENGNKRWLVVGNKDWFYLLPSQVDSVYPNIYFFGKLEVKSHAYYGLSSSLQYDKASENKATSVKTPLSTGIVENFLLHGLSHGKKPISLNNGRHNAPNGLSQDFPDIDSTLLLADLFISEKTSLYPLITLPCLKWLLNPYSSGYDYKTLEANKKFFLLKVINASNNANINGLVAFELS